eukprot:6212740-Pleurochrysis_carterae.AAC.8
MHWRASLWPTLVSCSATSVCDRIFVASTTTRWQFMAAGGNRRHLEHRARAGAAAHARFVAQDKAVPKLPLSLQAQKAQRGRVDGWVGGRRLPLCSVRLPRPSAPAPELSPSSHKTTRSFTYPHLGEDWRSRAAYGSFLAQFSETP